MFCFISFRGMPPNYQKIDNTVSRSAQPEKEDFSWLKDQGVTDVVNFRTMGKSGLDYDEKAVVEKDGMIYHNIKSVTKYPTEENVGQFLDVIEGVKQKGGKVHIHCKAGADRTGMYSYIYERMNNLKDETSGKQEWFNRGYHFNIYPKLMEWADKFLQRHKK